MVFNDAVFESLKGRVATLVFQHPQERQHLRARVCSVDGNLLRLGPVTLHAGSYDNMNMSFMRDRVVDVIEVDGQPYSLRALKPPIGNTEA